MGAGYALDLGEARLNSVKYAAEHQGISTADWIRLAIDRMLQQSASVLMNPPAMEATTRNSGGLGMNLVSYTDQKTSMVFNPIEVSIDGWAFLPDNYRPVAEAISEATRENDGE